MDTLSIAVAGFSAVSAVLLFCAFAFFIEVQGKSAYSVISCGVLLAALACIQLSHLGYFGGGAQPLQLGFSIPFIDDALFYHFYNDAIGLALAIMIVALISRPELIADLAEAARVRYGTSTLRDLDVDACVQKLGELMTVSKAYQNENLSLSALAEQLGISGHQLSELVNTRLGMGFSKYVRDCRVAAAKALLVSAPSQSILSISMDTGFRSQSAFYAAFKEATGQSPGDYRKEQLRNAPGFTPADRSAPPRPPERPSSSSA